MRAKFLEAFSDASEILSLPYSDRNYLFQEVALLSDESIRDWIEVIDESSFPLAEWLEALTHFQKWLQENKKGKKFSDQIEYISCCIQGSSNTGRLLTLPDLLKSYLENYGVQ